MEIRDAVIIDVDFDGDIPCEYTGKHVYYGEDMSNEVRVCVGGALLALRNFWLKAHSKDFTTDCESLMNVSLTDILNSPEYLNMFIYDGGDSWGNWHIEVSFIGELADKYFDNKHEEFIYMDGTRELRQIKE